MPCNTLFHAVAFAYLLSVAVLPPRAVAFADGSDDSLYDKLDDAHKARPVEGRHKRREGEKHSGQHKAASHKVRQGAHNTSSDDSNVPRGVTQATCQSPAKESLYDRIIANEKDRFFNQGAPELANLDGLECKVKLPGECPQWADKKSCCKRDFFQRLTERNDIQIKQFELVKYQYSHFSDEIVGSALDELKKLPESEHRTLIRLLQQLQLTKFQEETTKVVEYWIEECENPMRLFFGSVACKLCDPEVEQYLTERKYLHVSEDSCADLFSKCSAVPQKLRQASRSFKREHNHLQRFWKRGYKEELFSYVLEFMHRAHELLKDRSKQLIRIGYENQDNFCRRIASEGHRYVPCSWGNVLMAHLSNLAPEAEKPLQRELHDCTPLADVEDLNDRISARKSPDIQEVAEVASHHMTAVSIAKGYKAEAAVSKRPRMSTRARLSKRLLESGAQCRHGTREGNVCVCDPCYTGLMCDQAASDGPYVGQIFEPLLAQNVPGSQHIISVEGCNLQTNLDRQFARIKLMQYSKDEKDPCKQPIPDSAHRDVKTMLYHVPITATEGRYDYIVDFAIGEKGAYHVCYCYGFSCSSRPSMWYKLGLVKVVDTDSGLEQMMQQERDPKSLQDMLELKTRVECDDPYDLERESSISFKRTGDSLSFGCSSGFKNLVGPEQLVCVGGVWKVMKQSRDRTKSKLEETRFDSGETILEESLSKNGENVSSEGGGEDGEEIRIEDQNEKLAELAAWDPMQYPRCSIKTTFPSCPDADDIMTKDLLLVLNTDDQLPLYQCKDSAKTLVVGKDFGQLKEGDVVLVEEGSEDLVGDVLSYDNSSREYSVQLRLPPDGMGGPRNVVALAAENLRLVRLDRVLRRRCVKGAWQPEKPQLECIAHIPVERTLQEYQTVHFLDPTGGRSRILHKRSFSLLESHPNNELNSSRQEDAKAVETFSKIGSSAMLEMHANTAANSTKSGSMEDEAAGFAEMWPKPQTDFMNRWPIVISQDTKRVVHVDRCWISSRDCLTHEMAAGSVEVLARALDRRPAPKERPVPGGIALTVLLGLGLALLVGLLGWATSGFWKDGKKHGVSA